MPRSSSSRSSSPTSSSSDDAGPSNRRRPRIRRAKSVRQDHPSYQLTLNMMLGIRHQVSRVAVQKHKKLSVEAFTEVVKTDFPKGGTEATPAHSGFDFEFKDYAPLVFRDIRERCGIDSADYMLSICGDNCLAELLTPGKSGSFFYYSYDDKYLIKTVTPEEARFLRRVLHQYYEHVVKYPDSLVCRFYGLHRVRQGIGRKSHFCIMNNVFDTPYPIHLRYDLKGSTVGRQASDKEKESEFCVLKDLDMTEKIELSPNHATKLLTQLEKDAEFLAGLDIMDYSLLMGVHDRSREAGIPAPPPD
eukprot:GFYU01019298.1.p1 GENE.GFYU01019298.1~~GFYU01019298.1.p1  ORF type:complete len:303 (-),score=45.07 GFYU01019298.1:9-917(-)